MKIRLLLAGVLLCLNLPVRAVEGMWLPQLLAALNEKEMKAMGMKISADDIYHASKSSLKDAIVSFGGFCTAEVISDKGLILTNHHCGYSAIQSHTTLQNNYLARGFWAMKESEELPNPGLTATFIIRIEEVTEAILKGISRTLTESERQSRVDQNIARLRADTKVESWQNVLIRPFFEGNQYFLFVTETYQDVRLVGAPPSDIGKFGADTDNWMWPRHTGDFALFRIYAGPDNRPAPYSPNNKPYQPRRSIAINTKGLKEGEFTMVFGFPGRTQQYLPAAALQQTLQVINPAKIDIRDKALKIIDGFMRRDEQIKIQYASKYASTANAWKKWIGEVQGLKFSNAVDKRRLYEQEFTNRLSGNSQWRQNYGEVLPQLNALYARLDSLALYRDLYTETVLQIELLRQVTTLRAVMNRIQSNPETLLDERRNLMANTANFYKNYSPAVDKQVATVLLQNYINLMPARLLPSLLLPLKTGREEPADYLALIVEQIFSNSVLTSQEKFQEWLHQPYNDLRRTWQNDPVVTLQTEMQNAFAQNVQLQLNPLQEEINRLLRIYMQAQMEVMSERRFYPDANSTLRVTYGTVGGMEPRDGIIYKAYTYLEGVMEKYQPGDYEFNVPEKLIALHRNRDYGPYADQDGRLPVCFIASNHTTGGNSGSPALDANGYLVGLNFDRAWEGTMSDLNYDASICRNIMVDVRYILFIIDKFAGAGHLIQEMRLK